MGWLLYVIIGGFILCLFGAGLGHAIEHKINNPKPKRPIDTINKWLIIILIILTIVIIIDSL